MTNIRKEMAPRIMNERRNLRYDIELKVMYTINSTIDSMEKLKKLVEKDLEHTDEEIRRMALDTYQRATKVQSEMISNYVSFQGQHISKRKFEAQQKKLKAAAKETILDVSAMNVKDIKEDIEKEMSVRELLNGL